MEPASTPARTATGVEDEWRAGGERLTRTTGRMLAAMDSVVDGKHRAVRTALLVLLAGGHLLVEDVPGVGKTLRRTLVAGEYTPRGEARA